MAKKASEVHRNDRAFSLIEIMLASTLLLILFFLATDTMITGMKVAARGTQQASLQNQATVTLDWMESDLRQSALAQVQPFEDTDRKGLGMIRFSGEATAKGALVWEEKLVVYSWSTQSKRVLRQVWPQNPRVPALAITFSPGSPPKLQAADLLSICASCPNGRPLAQGVSKFLADNEPGNNLLQLSVELESPDGKERFKLERKLFLRN